MTPGLFCFRGAYINAAALSHVADGHPRRPVRRFGPYPAGHHQAGLNIDNNFDQLWLIDLISMFEMLSGSSPRPEE